MSIKKDSPSAEVKLPLIRGKPETVTPSKQRSKSARTRRLQLAYIAGFFDADGSVTIIHHLQANGKRYHDVAMNISQKDGRIIDFLHGILGGHIVWHNSETQGKYMLNFYGRKAWKALKMIYPYVRLKKKRVEIALKFCQLKARNYDNRPIKKKNLEARQKCMDEIRILNHTYAPSAAVETKYGNPYAGSDSPNFSKKKLKK